MAKGSGRFRNRKLGFKTRINVEIGVILEEDPLDEHLDQGDDGKPSKGIETGVDKDEEGEVHLQAVIAASSAAVARVDKGKKAAQAYIPTRQTTEIPDEEFRALYKSGYVDPFSYIRFSDTVEDCLTGAATYTMDEDDEDWLEEFNAQFPSSSGDVKGKGKEVEAVLDPTLDGIPLADLPPPSSALSEDDFELVMEVFELVTDQKAPMAHINLDLLPSVNDFDDGFNDILKPELVKLRPYAKEVYPHWRQRRVQRGGKQIIPQLDYDESNEQNPYVCFRRRELKTSRKTRRSDQQNLERLIRLRNDLYAAHALLVKVAERERMKLEALDLERSMFDERCEMRELKRRLNEPDGDEELLISRKEKRRKRDDQSTGSLRLSLRKPDPNTLSPALFVAPIEELQARRQRNDAIVKQIDRDLARKRTNDQHWDDWTDASYLSRPPPTPARFWRSVEPVPHSVPFNGPAGKREALGFATNYQPPLGRVRPSFRKRIGRGGRVLLDRISIGSQQQQPETKRKGSLPALEEDVGSEEEEEEDEWLAARRAERQRYDTDAGLDFPTADEPVLLDDFDLPYLLRRIGLLKEGDVEALSLDSSYLDAAFAFVSQDPDKNQPPPIVVGRPPPRPPLQMAPSQAAAAASPLPLQNGGPQQPNAVAYAQAQQQLAAQNQMRLQQQQLAVRKQMAAAAVAGGAGGGGGAGSDQMRRTPSQGSPNGVGQSSMPQLPMQLQQNGQPLVPGASPVQFHPSLPGGFPPQQQHTPLNINGNGLSLPPQQPPRPNGLAGSPQSQHLIGANGLPATSRLSAPPYSNGGVSQQQQQQLSNNAALHMALQAQQAQQLAAAGGSPVLLQQLQARPMSANGLVPVPGVHPPSRPTSAASTHHHSPHLSGSGNGGTIPLPPMNGTPSPANGRNPQQQQQQQQGKRSSPMVPVQLGPGGYPLVMAQTGRQGQSPMDQKVGQYGGFVQG